MLSKHDQNANILSLGDLYAKNQLLCIINALDAIEFENIIDTNREWILMQFVSD